MRRLASVVLLLMTAGLLAGCSLGGGSKDPATLRAERLQQPPELLAAGSQPAPQPAPATPSPAAGVLEHVDGQPRLLLTATFYEAWRQVGLAIDRLGFTLEDRNRAEGRYFVRYDPQADKERREKGFLESLAFWRDEPNQPALYVIQLTQDGGRTTAVAVTDEAGEPAPAEVAERILTLLREQLR